MTNMHSTKHNNKELVCKLSIYSNLQLILIQSLSMHTNNKNISAHLLKRFKVMRLLLLSIMNPLSLRLYFSSLVQ